MLAFLLAGLLVTAGAAPGLADEPDSPPQGFTAWKLPARLARALDGDTFEADLDGDGRIQEPRERVRLLWVDTPELGESHKGQDPQHGVPALAFLEARLAEGPLVLWIPESRPTGNYGRTLAEVRVHDRSLNLALVRAGHSYFDTRFSFPPTPKDYAAYAEAEAQAFTERLGIWREAESRRAYLQRLKRELKTPESPANPDFLPGIQRAEAWRPAAALGRYVRLEGTILARRTLGKGVRKLALRGRREGSSFPVVAFRGIAERLAVDGWQPGTRVRVEGFVKTWQGHPELVLHYGHPLP